MRRRILSVGTLLALSTGLSVCSCGSATPTAPDPLGSHAIVFNDAAGALRDHEITIRAILNSTLDRVADALQIAGVTITVTPGPGIAGYGIGGFTPSGGAIQIAVDPTFPGLAQVLPDRLPSIAAHELHHAKRWRGPGYGRTLLEALVSEGLADHFAIEFLGAPVPPWSDAFPRDQTAFFLAQARPEFDAAAYDHERWFFGTGPALPRWTGYTLGFRLVEAYQAAHPGITAAQLVNASATVFRP